MDGRSSPRMVAAFDQPAVRKDVRTLARFVSVYCDGLHAAATRAPLALPQVDVARLAGRPMVLCTDCRSLLAHAVVKRALCPFDPKPMCKHCPKHCYAPRYREQIRKVMGYAGKRMLLTGRLDYLLHLLF
jgi:hypothetical protein